VYFTFEHDPNFSFLNICPIFHHKPLIHAPFSQKPQMANFSSSSIYNVHPVQFNSFPPTAIALIHAQSAEGFPKQKGRRRFTHPRPFAFPWEESLLGH
jgi:hypothetical protein